MRRGCPRRSAPRAGPRLLVLLALGTALTAGQMGAWTWVAHADAPPSAASQGQDSPELRNVLKGLICRCGCNLTVDACEGTMTCDVAARMRAEATAKLGTGLTPRQVLDAFAADYGEQVLAAPTKRGFNLTAWILPFAALAVGGVVVTLALRGWRRRRPPPEGEVPEADPRYVAAVEEELPREV